MYNLKKWYFDFLTPQNDYFFVYFATVRLGPATMRSLTIHLACSNGVLKTRCIPIEQVKSSETEGDILRAALVGINLTATEADLTFSDKHCAVQLRYEACRGPRLKSVVIPGHGVSSIRWQPLGLKCRVSGFVSIDTHRIEVANCNGYIDYLESSCLPPFVPVRTLYWGRLSQPGLGLVFMQAAGSHAAPTWSALYGTAQESSFDGEKLIIEPLHPRLDAQADHGYSLRAMTAAGSIQMFVRHAAVVQQGSFIDQQKHSSRVARLMLKLLTRNPRSTKFLSFADFNLDLCGIRKEGRNVPMIDEYALL